MGVRSTATHLAGRGAGALTHPRRTMSEVAAAGRFAIGVGAGLVGRVVDTVMRSGTDRVDSRHRPGDDTGGAPAPVVRSEAETMRRAADNDRG